MNGQVPTDHIIALISKVNQYRASEDYYDVEIHVEGKAFKCHRLILAAASEYFHIMFSGQFKESTASEVTLQEVEAATFGEILQFIYTGNLTINSANLYKLVRAGEFFKLPHLEELFIQYVEQNEDRLIENGLEMLSYVRTTGKTNFGEILCRYIYKNFDYFSRTPEFCEMCLDDFISILNLMPGAPSMLQDTFMLAIMRWIRLTDHSPQASRSHFKDLLERINFSKLSPHCVEYLTRMNFENFIAFRRSSTITDESRSCLYATDSAVEQEVNDFECFHVYVNAYSEDQSKLSTNVFTLYKHFEEYKWYNSYVYGSNHSPYFLRSVVLDRRLYCLSFYGTSQATGSVQTFKTSSSISLFSNSTLKPPPLILDQYEMCGLNNHIYVYDRNSSIDITKSPYALSFSDEELSRGCFLYNREVDTWLPLPLPKRKLAYSSMTCDGERVYLVGGRNFQSFDTTDLRYVQCYDHRTPEWISLEPTNGLFEYSACCAQESKIYVSGGLCDPTAVEMYDPRKGWAQVAPMTQARTNHRIEPFTYSSHRLLVAVGDTLSSDADMEIYDTAENVWKMYTPSLHRAVEDSDLQFTYTLEIVDLVTYKPIGL